MVWFQCEDCGENLKKPKLPNHFRMCSAYKLSCIDCGEVFDQQRVQSHTQCITEAEKYGPKGQAKAASGTPAKPNNDKPKPDVDINIGLSNRYPWFCSLCNTKATSQQALLLHADGKKHRAKARAFTAKQQPNPPEEGAVTNKDSTENTPKIEVPNDKSIEDGKENGPSNGALRNDYSSAENGNVSVKKRKKDTSIDMEKCVNGVVNGFVTQEEAEEAPKKSKKGRKESEVKGTEKKKAKNEAKEGEGGITGTGKKGAEQKIKWKKLISSVLKSVPLWLYWCHDI
ncbi:UBP1-associated proteins 1C-like isoform X2 [Chenopodium quinoa]|uniref:UBP1-associated proteins 1C-like isoform X2 n=1 Tax=Chenopodium quinoa TaxID=63459 RepID=UPI000B77CE68|nr:UBP1-associated proteins 1C-like isoform X2 [Chenopodium quinoa]